MYLNGLFNLAKQLFQWMERFNKVKFCAALPIESEAPYHLVIWPVNRPKYSFQVQFIHEYISLCRFNSVRFQHCAEGLTK